MTGRLPGPPRTHRFPPAPWPARRAWPDVLATDLLRSQAAARADSPAILAEGAGWSYRDLHTAVVRVASALRGAGVGPEAVVGVDVPRSPEQIVAVLGVLSAGGAYLPLDPATPVARSRRLVELAGARLLLTDGASRLPAASGLPRMRIEEIAAGGGGEAQPPERPCGPDNLAYVIGTSGTSGEPKLVAVTHRSLVNQVLWRRASFELSSADRVLYKAPFGTDVAVGEVLNPLCAGASVVVCPPDAEMDPDHVVRLSSERRVTVAYFVGSMLGAALEAGMVARCPHLRILNAGAEVLPAGVRDRVVSQRPGLLWHTYGPTECAITALAARCRADPEVTLDHACTNVSAHLVDGDGRSVPAGGVGELYLSGPALARGYAGGPGRTAERFLPLPGGGGRWYRTGDLFRAREDGRLVFAGRRDRTIKVAGRLLAPEEVELALQAHPGVRECAAVPVTGDGGEVRVHTFVALLPGTDPAGVREVLAGRLPPYALPAGMTAVTALPRLAGGKVDRALLAERAGSTTPPAAPPADLEAALGQLWSELLGIPRIDSDQDLGRYGLTSLALMRARSRLRSHLGVSVGLRELSDARTIRDQCLLIANRSGER